jgi:hypothetical protein
MKVTKNQLINGYIHLDIETDPDNPQNSIIFKIDTKGSVYNEIGYLLRASDFNQHGEAIGDIIRELVEFQKERSQELRNAVIEDLKEAMAQGDDTTIDEILKFVPHINLIETLPEERWKDFYFSDFNQSQNSDSL